MGVTVAFTGRQAEPRFRQDALEWAQGFATDMEWDATPVSVERHRGFLGNQVLEVPRVEGLSLLPHFACEPVPLLFLDSSGHVVDSVLVDEGDGDIRVEPQVLVKTQFAGAGVHIEVCQFLAALKKAYVPDLEVDDETGFFSTGDERRLTEALDAGWERILHEISELREPGAALAIGGIPLRVPAEDRPAGAYAQVTDEHRELLDGLESWLSTRYGGFGLDFDRTLSSIEHLDLLMLESDKEGWCDDLEDAEAERLAHALGATFGRTVATVLGGQWELDESEGLMLSEVGSVGLQMNPFQVAADRIARGPSYAFAHHFAVYEDLVKRLSNLAKD